MFTWTPNTLTRYITLEIIVKTGFAWFRAQKLKNRYFNNIANQFFLFRFIDLKKKKKLKNLAVMADSLPAKSARVKHPRDGGGGKFWLCSCGSNYSQHVKKIKWTPYGHHISHTSYHVDFKNTFKQFSTRALRWSHYIRSTESNTSDLNRRFLFFFLNYRT